MAEIKSTLDIVLEKTKNLKLSSEEIKEQKNKEIEMRVKGLLQKYLDGMLSLEKFNNDYEKLCNDRDLTSDTILINQIVDRLELDQDNQTLLGLLKTFGMASTALESVSIDYQNAYQSAAQNRIEQLKNELAANHCISGSAVVPNLDADEQWRRDVQGIRIRFEEKLIREKDKLRKDNQKS